ncbi:MULTISPECIES: 3-hydroxyisobutyrate dehydrogenase [unclassified Shewanella]|uniref:3-hydroxyisobutyrate dehydrogenase n=1 Tax=unclassified Shewanella TaxID=196818 RepID=UPI000C85E559|nr:MULTISPECIES: 3-hydroxyisobutyrate dehydrogenase [unclassified Shewanella]MDO6620583.1 3-hydroxyisobutyrate dehydrogenase [Shewanella sp. 6_MG-2023]MDO6680014.1 3-hydroxyisobutyrate dehydrogenase [Shewanella sp. 4_MG-2023]MDO6776740.1 3-hydroxyisobutyrate dehydrogenase [Shewanella sp. 3_MG-2023]PMG39287.1 3-hydroxyisobutyrate dehydrogenase [Shewanella sp. 10N.286.52.B9]PMH87420.1 3-hydroxyisobutyrate dehydrogenase [Shewanella sp. 10N.286.48.B5]
MATVAFIGLGNMGGPMAANLIKAGMTVTVFDLVPAAVEALTKQGALSAKTACGAAAAADYIITMLPAGKHVHSLYIGDDDNKGLLDVVAKDAILIDCSTIDAGTAQTVGAQAAAKGIEFMDAPVSGGTAGAAAGTLTFICGGSDNAYDKAQTVLTVMGANIFHAGAAGAGQIAKICNNMLLSVLMVGTSESLQLGIDNGLDPKVLSDIMKVSSGGNWTLEKYNPCPDVMDNVPSSNDYQGGFMVDLMVKDLGLSQQASLASNSSTPMGALARSLYVNHARQGNGRRDFSSIFEQFAKADEDK